MDCFRAIIVLLLLFPVFASAQVSEPARHVPSEERVRSDLGAILNDAKFEGDLITFHREGAHKEWPENSVAIACKGDHFELTVRANDDEWSPAFYFALQELGFLFPHPRWQISPSLKEMKRVCGTSVVWQPRFRYRGFHLHTMHPSEWLHGFLMGQKRIAREMINWSVRNGQNTLQVVLLKNDLENIQDALGDLTRDAQGAGLAVGLDVSFTLAQQRAFRLVNSHPFIGSILERSATKQNDIETNIEKLARALSFDFLTIELGSSEFSSVNDQETIAWMNLAGRVASEFGKAVFIKAHASINQFDDHYGNFNFLAQYADSRVGVLPHTVFFYGLIDPSTPVYGRHDFRDVQAFMVNQRSKRETWYFPETSYFIALDIDVPLLLTDYLTARSADLDVIEAEGVSGHLDFTTGQELGSWLFDWTTALLTNSEYKRDPLIGLKLLGEDLNVWKPILDFQSEFFKRRGAIEEITSENLLDELPLFPTHVLARTTLRELTHSPARLNAQISLLEQAERALPDVSGVENVELRNLLRVTNLRVQFALEIRRAIRDQRDGRLQRLDLERANRFLTQAQLIMTEVARDSNRYPEAHIFDRHSNPSSYQFGYGWTAKTLHFWHREEEMVRMNSYNPLFMNIYDPFRILF